MSSISENRSTLKEFLASIATIRGDLSNITAPPFVLATQSTVELPAYWVERPSIFVAPALEKDPQTRALLVLKWFLSSLKQQQYAGRDEKDGVKKPLNAFLGELFLAGWADEHGRTELISEQVSHHPPVTACYLSNEDCGIRAEGYTRQEITLSFPASINIQQIGHAILHLDSFNENYLIPLPSVRVKGVLSGTLYPELKGTYHISSSNGLTSEIDFSGRGLFSGKKNRFCAKLYHQDQKNDVLYTVDGHWNDTFTFHDNTAQTDLETFDTNAQPALPLDVPSLEHQDSWESRKAWAGVISALHAGNMQRTSDEKKKVEEGQRRMRKEEESKGVKWDQKFFTKEEDDVVWRALARNGEELGVEKTVGVWRFDQGKKERAERPFRGSLTPTG